MPRHLTKLLFLALGACSAAEQFPDATFTVDVKSETEATLKMAGSTTWHANEVTPDDYRGWATKYDAAAWSSSSAELTLTVEQVGKWATGKVQLADSIPINLPANEYGFGWLSMYRDPRHAAQKLNLENAGLVDANEEGTMDCTLKEARVLMSLSSYPGTAHELIAEATGSAEAQGRPVPTDWHEIVVDPAMYALLFQTHGTDKVWNATFAYLAVYLDPVCGDQRVAIRTERELVGFVVPVE